MLWRLERGERLGLLDLLAGSTTVVNTILTQMSLRVLSAAGLILILAWAISPLGGQASLRVITIAQQNTTSTAPVKYMSTNHSFSFYATLDLGPLVTLVDGLYNADRDLMIPKSGPSSINHSCSEGTSSYEPWANEWQQHSQNPWRKAVVEEERCSAV